MYQDCHDLSHRYPQLVPSLDVLVSSPIKDKTPGRSLYFSNGAGSLTRGAGYLRAIKNWSGELGRRISRWGGLLVGR